MAWPKGVPRKPRAAQGAQGESAVVIEEEPKMQPSEAFGDEPVKIGQVGFRTKIRVHTRELDPVVNFESELARQRFTVTYHLGVLHIAYRPPRGSDDLGPADIYVPASNISFMRRAKG